MRTNFKHYIPPNKMLPTWINLINNVRMFCLWLFILFLYNILIKCILWIRSNKNKPHQFLTIQTYLKRKFCTRKLYSIVCRKIIVIISRNSNINSIYVEIPAVLLHNLNLCAFPRTQWVSKNECLILLHYRLGCHPPQTS